MAITFDAVGTGSSTSWTHVTASQSNLAMVVFIASDATPSAVSYNSIAMTQKGSHTGTLTCWELVNPSTGSNTVSVTIAGQTFIFGASLTYISVAQTGTAGNTSGNTGTGSSSSNTIVTTASSQFVIEGTDSGNGGTNNTPSNSQTKRAQVGTSGTAVGDIAASGASMTLGWSFGVSGTWSQMDTVINAFVNSLTALPANFTFTGSNSNTVTITNNSNGTESWTGTILGAPSWISINPTSGGPLAINGTSIVTITVNATGLAPGTYVATIQFTSGSVTANVNVTLIVGGFPTIWSGGSAGQFASQGLGIIIGTG